MAPTAMQQDLARCESGRVMQGTGGNFGTWDQGDAANELRASDATDQRLTITPNPSARAQ
ncbi:MAG: hypothetical protein IPH53_11890 [Flavobacteriales bacterium]|nr:hypothetical protein [Flavobacteriales bacterium]